LKTAIVIFVLLISSCGGVVAADSEAIEGSSFAGPREVVPNSSVSTPGGVFEWDNSDRGIDLGVEPVNPELFGPEERHTVPEPQQPELVTVDQPGGDEITLGLGDSSRRTVTVTATRRLSDVRLRTTTPLGVRVDAEPREIDQLAAGERADYEFTVTADRPVRRTLDIVVEASFRNGTLRQRIPYSVAVTTDQEVEISQLPDQQEPLTRAIGGSTTQPSSSDTAVSAQSTGNNSIVRGQAAYTDGDDVPNLSAVDVTLYDTDGETKQLQTATTTPNGKFNFTVDPTNDADGDGEINATVVVHAENDAVYVTDGSDTYGYKATSDPLSAGDTATLGTDLDDDGSTELVSAGDNAPYQAVDWAYDGHEFAADNGVSKTKLPIRYPTGDWAYYQWWTDGRERILLPDRSEYYWDEGTVYHEYGHGVDTQLIGYIIRDKDSYTCHTYVSETDPAYAITEGFAEYYAAAVADDPDEVSWGFQNIETNQFYDTNYTGQCANGDGNGEYDGLSVEGSAASIFWDITDGGDNDDDDINRSFSAIADVFEDRPRDMNQFYRGWDKGSQRALDEIYTTYGIDKLPPAVRLAANEAVYTDSEITLNGTVTDERGTNSLELSVDGDSYSTVATSDGNWSSTRTLDDGTHRISFRATDVGGISNTTTETVRVSTVPPTVSTSDARLSDFVSPGGSVTVGLDYAARYPRNVTVRILDNETEIATTSVTDLDSAVDTTAITPTVRLPESLSEGRYDVELRITDDAGRINTTRLNDTITADTTPPTVGAATVDDSYVNASTPLSFDVDADDNGTVESGVETVRVDSAIGRDNATLTETNGSWRGTIAPNGSDGSHTAVVTVVDTAGNTNRTTVSYQVDTESPTVTASTPRYTNNTTVAVSGNATDERLASLAIRTPNGTQQLDNATGSYETTVELAEGSNTLTVVGTDAADNTAHQRITVGVDQTPPTARLETPPRINGGEGPRATNRTSPSLQFGVSDAVAGLNETATAATATVDGSSAPATADRANGTVTVEGATLDDGSHTVTVELVDRAGNTRTETATFVVDTTSPRIRAVSQPNADNRTITPGDNLTVTVEANDTVTTIGSVVVGDTQLQNSSGTWRGNVTAPVRIGNQPLPVRVVDATGNVNETTTTTYVGTRQTAASNDTGVVSLSPTDQGVDNVTVDLNETTVDNGTVVELTSAVTDSNPTAESVPDEHVVSYAQFEFNVSRTDTEGGSFVTTVSRSDLRNASGLEETVTFWLFNESADTWTELNGSRLASSNTTLTYRVETPHYSTFAVSSAVDDEPPTISLERPSNDSELTDDSLLIRATFADDESAIQPNETAVWLNGTALNLSKSTVRNETTLELRQPVETGTYNLSLRVADEFDNERLLSTNVTVTDPAPASGGGGFSLPQASETPPTTNDSGGNNDTEPTDDANASAEESTQKESSPDESTTELTSVDTPGFGIPSMLLALTVSTLLARRRYANP
jgi:PGF-pre-PGF domain-containing protein